MRRFAVVLLGVAVLAGCTGGDQSSPSVEVSSSRVETPTPTPTPSPSLPMRFDDVVALRDAAVKAGLPCPSWEQRNLVKLAASSGTCSDQDVLSVYLSEDAVQQSVDVLKTLGPVHLLVGPNWIINHSDELTLHVLKVELGGMIVVTSE